jgi:hypothetical protein
MFEEEPQNFVEDFLAEERIFEYREEYSWVEEYNYHLRCIEVRPGGL